VTTVHLNDSELVDDLMELLRGSACIVDRIGPRSVAIRSGWLVRDDAAQYELDGYLRVFEAMPRVPGRCETAGKPARPRHLRCVRWRAA
jgi:hypothetical protein